MKVKKKPKEPNWLAVALVGHLREGYTDKQIEQSAPGLLEEAEPNHSRYKLHIVDDTTSNKKEIK